jgi:hypothetical protein
MEDRRGEDILEYEFFRAEEEYISHSKENDLVAQDLEVRREFEKWMDEQDRKVADPKPKCNNNCKSCPINSKE